MDYAVVYSSKTGNTEKVAMAVFEAIPGKSKDISRVEEWTGNDADTYFVGFWNNRGTCSGEIMDFLSALHGKRIALFGTCGMGESREYFDRVANQVSALIPDDNVYLGYFLCGGKMPTQVLENYKRLREKKDSEKIRIMIHGYEQAMLHPDDMDLKAAGEFVRHLLQ